MKEFSKIMVVAFSLVWLAVVRYGAWYCVEYETGFSEFLAFVGAPMAAGVVGYLCKAGFENVQKIKNSINERE